MTDTTPVLPAETRYRVTLRHLTMDDLVPLVRLLEQYETSTGRQLTVGDPEVEAAGE